MSTELKSQCNGTVFMNRFAGGEGRGTCVQVSHKRRSNDPCVNTSPYTYVQFTRAEALEMAAALLAFGMGNEVEDQ